MYAKGMGVPKDYAKAMQWYQLAADQGYALAQSNLGVMYNNGQGVPRDRAQYKLGMAYEMGKGVAKNRVESMKWHLKAAEQGHADALFTIGYMYDKGEGVPENDAEAVKWYRSAAEDGDIWAQNILGVLYAKGVGVPEDFVQAYAWWDLAGAQGYKPPARNKESLRKMMTPVQVVEALRLSRGLCAKIPGCAK